MNNEYGEEEWILNQTLYANDAAWGDEFGISVSISNNYAIIGAHYDDALTEVTIMVVHIFLN